MNALLRFGESLFPHLLDTVCQGTLLVLVILGISRVVGRSRVRASYWLQTWCLTGLVLLPIVSLLARRQQIVLFRICHASRSAAITMGPAKPSPSETGIWPAIDGRIVTGSRETERVLPTAGEESNMNEAPRGAENNIPREKQAGADASAVKATERGKGDHGSWVISSWQREPTPARAGTKSLRGVPWRAWVSIVWFAGCAVMLVRLLLAARYTARIRRRSLPVSDPRILDLFERARNMSGLRRKVEVRVSPGLSSPMSMGFFRPTVFLPKALPEELSAEQLRPILLHELAHVRSWDYAVNMMERFVECFYFFHPLVLLVGRRLKALREEISDDNVVAHCPDRVFYAKVLTEVASRSLCCDTGGFAPLCFFNRRGQIERRVQRILSSPKRFTEALRVKTVVVLLSVSSALVGGLSLLSFSGRAAEKPDDDRLAAETAATEPLAEAVKSPKGTAAALDKERQCEFINLAPYVTSLLTYLHDRDGNDLPLTPGKHQAGGVEFQVANGVIQVAGTLSQVEDVVLRKPPLAPLKVEGMKVGLTFRKLHILHGTGYSAVDGTRIGTYVIHYQDGGIVEIPIEYGVHMKDWWWGDSAEVSGGQVAWTGENRLSPLRLYSLTWENPHPDRAITAIDLVSSGTDCAPFLVAMTAEEAAPSASPAATEPVVLEPGVGTSPAKTAAESSPKASAETLPTPVKGTLVVINRSALAKSLGDKLDSVLNAASILVGGNKARILDAGGAYEHQFAKPLGTHIGVSRGSTEKARWLQDWLSLRAAPGSTIVLLGDEGALPTWQARLGGMSITTDSLYSDLSGDGVPDTAVSRILGSPEMMVRQLQGKEDYEEKAVILCSEDTRIHLETRAFVKSLSRLGYQVAIRGARDDETLAASDFIIHFGHGSPSGISNRFGEGFVSAGDMPALPRSPVVFVDGCGTLPVGSPLLLAFLRQGAVAYVGSTATVQGMIPARFTNELVEHFLRVLRERPDSPIPQVLTLARARYVNGHKGLAEKLRHLATEGAVDVSGDESTDLLTVAEWVYYGDPRASIPNLGPAKDMSREVMSLSDPIRLDQTNEAWETTIVTREDDGQCVLSLYADIPLRDRQSFRLSVRQNGEELSLVDSHRDTVYQRLGDDCRGGYVSGGSYLARFLLPLRPGQGEQELEVRLLEGDSAVLTRGTEVDVWPPDFEKRIGLRKASPAPPFIATTPTEVIPRKPIKAIGRAEVVQVSAPGFQALDFSSLLNRPHHSMQVGGGDNASFKTWFSEDKVFADDVPFVVKRSGNDVLVSADNTENVFEIGEIQASAHLLHFLVWGYNYPREPAKICIAFTDGSEQEGRLPLKEWTRGVAPIAFDFENTVEHFRHAAIAHEVIEIAHPNKKIKSINSSSGAYGLIAITLEED